ncbi:MAG: isoaspartyl peptidase/L-asparaginase [Arenimonas sp.]|nr:isoaspartyl peptidase/L-asparaginase [Arenimonas sp.]
MSESLVVHHKTALVIHGGAGVMSRSSMSAETEATYLASLNEALDAGNVILQQGGTARAAVIASILVLENSPLFNAGKGSVFNAEGGHELDASIMEGHTSKAGAVAGVTTIKNPILLAEAVMEHSPHVMLSMDGAEIFADTQPDIERVAPDYFDTAHRLEQLHATQADERASASQDLKGKYFGTVGAVALDAHGHIAAGTSTGGMTNKRWSRVGDSPIIGAGTYANEQCGVSGTGWGEFFIRAVVAHDICARVKYRGDSLSEAAEEVLLKIVPEMGGDGGAIALDKDGNISLPFNTEGMYRGWIKPDGSRGVAIFKE